MSLPDRSWDCFGEIGPFRTPHAALLFIETHRRNENDLLLAVIDKQAEKRGEDGFAGIYGIIECDHEMVSCHASINSLLETKIHGLNSSITEPFTWNDQHSLSIPSNSRQYPRYVPRAELLVRRAQYSPSPIRRRDV